MNPCNPFFRTKAFTILKEVRLTEPRSVGLIIRKYHFQLSHTYVMFKKMINFGLIEKRTRRNGHKPVCYYTTSAIGSSLVDQMIMLDQAKALTKKIN